MKHLLFTSFIVLYLVSFTLQSTSQTNSSAQRKSLSQYSIHWYWKDNFSLSEKQKLKNWIEKTIIGIKQLIGSYPFDIHIYFHRLNNSTEPVPWAHTQRSNRQGVHFYVDPSFDTKDFLNDWTAPHELSHLAIPYINKENMWFSEGFASFMQYQIMHKMALLTQDQITLRYKKRIERAARRYKDRYYKIPFTQAANDLRLKRDYPTLYWSGSIYFFQVNQRLKSEINRSLIEILNEYLLCCHVKYDSLKSLTKELDSISKTTIFSEQLKIFDNKQGYPDYLTIFK